MASIPAFEGLAVHAVRLQLKAKAVWECPDDEVLEVDDVVRLAAEGVVVGITIAADPRTGDLVRTQAVRLREVELAHEEICAHCGARRRGGR